VRVVHQFEIHAIEGYWDMRPLRILVGPFGSKMMHSPHVLLVLPLVVVIVIGSSGDCKYHTEGWVVDCCLIGLARELYFYLLLWLGWRWRRRWW
jgi:hypothetical protein